MELSIPSALEQRFLLIPILYKRQPVLLPLRHLDMVWTGLHSNILLHQGPYFIFLFNWLVVYMFPTTPYSVIKNYTVDLLFLLKENFKNLLFDSLIKRRSSENLSYLSSWLLWRRWRFRRICSNVLGGIESNFASTKVLRVFNQYILRSRNLWHSLSSSILKNKQIFPLVISKLSLYVCFLSMTVQLGVANNNIN